MARGPFWGAYLPTGITIVRTELPELSAFVLDWSISGFLPVPWHLSRETKHISALVSKHLVDRWYRGQLRKSSLKLPLFLLEHLPSTILGEAKAAAFKLEVLVPPWLSVQGFPLVQSLPCEHALSLLHIKFLSVEDLYMDIIVPNISAEKEQKA